MRLYFYGVLIVLLGSRNFCQDLSREGDNGNSLLENSSEGIDEPYDIVEVEKHLQGEEQSSPYFNGDIPDFGEDAGNVDENVAYWESIYGTEDVPDFQIPPDIDGESIFVELGDMELESSDASEAILAKRTPDGTKSDYLHGSSSAEGEDNSANLLQAGVLEYNEMQNDGFHVIEEPLEHASASDEVVESKSLGGTEEMEAAETRSVKHGNRKVESMFNAKLKLLQEKKDFVDLATSEAHKKIETKKELIDSMISSKADFVEKEKKIFHTATVAGLDHAGLGQTIKSAVNPGPGATNVGAMLDAKLDRKKAFVHSATVAGLGHGFSYPSGSHAEILGSILDAKADLLEKKKEIIESAVIDKPSGFHAAGLESILVAKADKKKGIVADSVTLAGLGHGLSQPEKLKISGPLHAGTLETILDAEVDKKHEIIHSSPAAELGHDQLNLKKSRTLEFLAGKSSGIKTEDLESILEALQAQKHKGIVSSAKVAGLDHGHFDTKKSKTIKFHAGKLESTLGDKVDDITKKKEVIYSTAAHHGLSQPKISKSLGIKMENLGSILESQAQENKEIIHSAIVAGLPGHGHVNPGKLKILESHAGKLESISDGKVDEIAKKKEVIYSTAAHHGLSQPKKSKSLGIQMEKFGSILESQAQENKEIIHSAVAAGLAGHGHHDLEKLKISKPHVGKLGSISDVKVGEIAKKKEVIYSIPAHHGLSQPKKSESLGIKMENLGSILESQAQKNKEIIHSATIAGLPGHGHHDLEKLKISKPHVGKLESISDAKVDEIAKKKEVIYSAPAHHGLSQPKKSKSLGIQMEKFGSILESQAQENKEIIHSAVAAGLAGHGHHDLEKLKISKPHVGKLESISDAKVDEIAKKKEVIYSAPAHHGLSQPKKSKSLGIKMENLGSILESQAQENKEIIHSAIAAGLPGHGHHDLEKLKISKPHVGKLESISDAKVDEIAKKKVIYSAPAHHGLSLPKKSKSLGSRVENLESILKAQAHKKKEIINSAAVAGLPGHGHRNPGISKILEPHAGALESISDAKIVKKEEITHSAKVAGAAHAHGQPENSNVLLLGAKAEKKEVIIGSVPTGGSNHGLSQSKKFKTSKNHDKNVESILESKIDKKKGIIHSATVAGVEQTLKQSKISETLGTQTEKLESISEATAEKKKEIVNSGTVSGLGHGLGNTAKKSKSPGARVENLGKILEVKTNSDKEIVQSAITGRTHGLSQPKNSKKLLQESQIGGDKLESVLYVEKKKEIIKPAAVDGKIKTSRPQSGTHRSKVDSKIEAIEGKKETINSATVAAVGSRPTSTHDTKKKNVQLKKYPNRGDAVRQIQSGLIDFQRKIKESNISPAGAKTTHDEKSSLRPGSNPSVSIKESGLHITTRGHSNSTPLVNTTPIIGGKISSDTDLTTKSGGDVEKSSTLHTQKEVGGHGVEITGSSITKTLSSSQLPNEPSTAELSNISERKPSLQITKSIVESEITDGRDIVHEKCAPGQCGISGKLYVSTSDKNENSFEAINHQEFPDKQELLGNRQVVEIVSSEDSKVNLGSENHISDSKKGIDVKSVEDVQTTGVAESAQAVKKIQEEDHENHGSVYSREKISAEDIHVVPESPISTENHHSTVSLSTSEASSSQQDGYVTSVLPTSTEGQDSSDVDAVVLGSLTVNESHKSAVVPLKTGEHPKEDDRVQSALPPPSDNLQSQDLSDSLAESAGDGDVSVSVSPIIIEKHDSTVFSKKTSESTSADGYGDVVLGVAGSENQYSTTHDGSGTIGGLVVSSVSQESSSSSSQSEEPVSGSPVLPGDEDSSKSLTLSEEESHVILGVPQHEIQQPVYPSDSSEPDVIHHVASGSPVVVTGDQNSASEEAVRGVTELPVITESQVPAYSRVVYSDEDGGKTSEYPNHPGNKNRESVDSLTTSGEGHRSRVILEDVSHSRDHNHVVHSIKTSENNYGSGRLTFELPIPTEDQDSSDTSSSSEEDESIVGAGDEDADSAKSLSSSEADVPIHTKSSVDSVRTFEDNYNQAVLLAGSPPLEDLANLNENIEGRLKQVDRKGQFGHVVESIVGEKSRVVGCSRDIVGTIGDYQKTAIIENEKRTNVGGGIIHSSGHQTAAEIGQLLDDFNKEDQSSTYEENFVKHYSNAAHNYPSFQRHETTASTAEQLAHIQPCSDDLAEDVEYYETDGTLPTAHCRLINLDVNCSGMTAFMNPECQQLNTKVWQPQQESGTPITLWTVKTYLSHGQELAIEMQNRAKWLCDQGLIPQIHTPAMLHLINNYATETGVDINHESEYSLFGTKLLQRRFSSEFDVTPNTFVEFLQNHAFRVIGTGLCHPRPKRCESNQLYRTFDGACNNANHPTWGQANTAFARILPARYYDGVHEPPKSILGFELPNPRALSVHCFSTRSKPDHKITLALVQWGQLLSHDFALQTIDQTVAGGIRCCDDGKQLPKKFQHHSCLPIDIPADDKFYSRYQTRCMNFVRSMTISREDCTLGPADQLNTVTSYLDLSPLYGSNKETCDKLRAFKDGRMSVAIRRGRELLPVTTERSRFCDVMSPSEVCYLAGDVRVNQNPQLAIMQTILLREHNRIADQLSSLNPHWDDERIFQESRKIVIAEYQHITYNEWLPVVVGKRYSQKHRLTLRSKNTSMSTEYDPRIKAATINSFTTAAFRFFHSMVEGNIDLCPANREISHTLRLSNHYFRPQIIERSNNLDDLIRGLVSQPMQQGDDNFHPEIKEYLFRSKNEYGMDLESLDIQRGRDHGLPCYNAYRKLCGLKYAKSFEDLSEEMEADSIEKLKSIYAHVDDIDLIVGLILEKKAQGSILGPTVRCVLSEQFYRSKIGDRYFYDNADQPHSFTQEQFAEIRKASFARLLCDNGDNIERVQARGFKILSERNNLKCCCNLPQINLSFWRDVKY